MEKIFVEVFARHDRQGQIHPEAIIWQDGRLFAIDKVLDVRPAASLRAGGQGMRYTSDIRGNVRYLFHENDGLWFVEGR